MLDPFGSARNLYSNTDTQRKGLTQKTVDIFRDHGPAWRGANAGHVSLGQLKVMAAIESCRTAALGGHVARCEDYAHTVIAYNCCRNRHCPKCQGAAAKQWLAEREAELLPVPYFHVVFTLPAPVADIAYQNKAVHGQPTRQRHDRLFHPARRMCHPKSHNAKSGQGHNPRYGLHPRAARRD